MSGTDRADSRDDFESQLLELSREVERQSLTSFRDAQADETQKENLDGRDELAKQFEKFSREIGDKMGMLVDQLKRKNALESANERLFDAMHGELKSYKEAAIFEATQKPFLLDLIHLKDDLRQVAAQLAEPTMAVAADSVQAAAHNLDNALHFIDEILSRHSVEEIRVDGQLEERDRRTVGTRRSEDHSRKPGDILEVKRSGYRWRGRILRPVDVIVEAKPEGA